MKKVEWLDRSVMKCPYFCLALTEKDFDKIVNELKIPKDERPKFLAKGKDAEVTYFEKGNQTACVVSIKDYKENEFPIVMSLLVHEATHISQDMLDWMNERNPGKEFQAYSIQWISQQLFYSFFKQTGIKIPKFKRSCP